MARFRVTAGQFGEHGEGDEFEGDDGLAEEWPRRLEVVDAAASDVDGDDDESGESLTDLDGVGESMADRLSDAGFETPADVRAADPDVLAGVEGIGSSRAQSLVADEMSQTEG